MDRITIQSSPGVMRGNRSQWASWREEKGRSRSSKLSPKKGSHLLTPKEGSVSLINLERGALYPPLTLWHFQKGVPLFPRQKVWVRLQPSPGTLVPHLLPWAWASLMGPGAEGMIGLDGAQVPHMPVLLDPGLLSVTPSFPGRAGHREH